jgi:hypothetical protein
MRPRHLSSTLAAALVTVAHATAGSAASARPDDPETARLRVQVERLRHERDLASAKGFYLRLDAAGRRLSLMLQGVALDDYPASGVEWGVPEVLFLDRGPGADWDAAPFSKGRLEPARERDRLEVMAPTPAPAAGAPGADASPSPPPIPKSAEEAYSVPSPYRIVFAEGVSLEVRSQGGGSRNRSAFRRLADAASLRLSDLATAVGLGATERVRLRVTLAADDAASIYRSLPPDVSLIVVGLPPR